MRRAMIQSDQKPALSGPTIYADREMLAAAVENLLHNEFKFTIRHTEVWLRGNASDGRVVIEVEDHCGGVPEGASDRLGVTVRSKRLWIARD